MIDDRNCKKTTETARDFKRLQETTETSIIITAQGLQEMGAGQYFYLLVQFACCQESAGVPYLCLIDVEHK